MRNKLGRKPAITPELERQIVEVYNGTSHGYRGVAKLLNVSTEQVRGAVKRRKSDITIGQKKGGRPFETPDEQTMKAVSVYLATSMTLYEAAAMYGTTVNKLRYWANKALEAGA